VSNTVDDTRFDRVDTLGIQSSGQLFYDLDILRDWRKTCNGLDGKSEAGQRLTSYS